MLKLINEEVLVLPNGRTILFYILDTDDFVVDILTYDELVQVLRSGQVEIENLYFDGNKLAGVKIVQGILPDKFRHFSMSAKMKLLNFQSSGACLLHTEEFNDFYRDGLPVLEQDLDVQCARLINYTVRRNANHEFKLVGNFYICADQFGFFHLVYKDITSKVQFPIEININVSAPDLLYLYRDDASRILTTGGFSELAVFDSKSSTLCVNVWSSQNRGVAYKIDLAMLNREIKRSMETGNIMQVTWQMYASQE